jgi:REP element-mobilizing transposase RayT
VLTAYGNWLPGDPRGFRTTKHREHVEGDYKSPPPEGKYDALHAASKESMVDPRYRIPRSVYEKVSNALRQVFAERNVYVMCLSVQGAHCHLLLKASRFYLNNFVALAKRKAAVVCRKVSGRRRIWARKRSRKKIQDLAHFRRTYKYILRHELQGAYTWKSDLPCS